MQRWILSIAGRIAPILLVSLAGLAVSISGAPNAAANQVVMTPAPPRNGELQSKTRYAVNVTCQVIRSRAQSSLAGTVTENYQMEWSVFVRNQRIVVNSLYGTAEAHWEPDPNKSKVGQMTLTRSDLVKLLGLEQELPQDLLLWQPEMPVLVPILEHSNRGIDQILRHADDNGMLIIRLAVRL